MFAVAVAEGVGERRRCRSPELGGIACALAANARVSERG